MMESKGDAHPRFHPFPNLPLEIRNQIWFHALPALKPSLHFYRSDCWRLEPFHPSAKGYDPSKPWPQVSFRPELVKKTWFEVPLVYVNHEARQATLNWAKEHGLTLCSLPNTQRLVFLRPFNMNSDALGIPYDRWDDALFELDDRLGDPDLIDQGVAPLADVKRIVMSTRLLDKTVLEVGDLLNNYTAVEALYIIDDAKLLELELMNRLRFTGPRQSWGYRPSGGKSWRWNPEKRKFEIQGSEQIGSPELYKLMEEASQVIAERLCWFIEQHEFCIVPARLYEL